MHECRSGSRILVPPLLNFIFSLFGELRRDFWVLKSCLLFSPYSLMSCGIMRQVDVFVLLLYVEGFRSWVLHFCFTQLLLDESPNR